jgi:hypothetical protein
MRLKSGLFQKRESRLALVGIACSAAAIVLSLMGVAHAADTAEPRIGRITANLLSGKRFEGLEGNARTTINFYATGELSAEISGRASTKGLWWVDPAGRLCMVDPYYWTGGECFEALIDAQNQLAGIRVMNGSQTIRVNAKGSAL